MRRTLLALAGALALGGCSFGYENANGPRGAEKVGMGLWPGGAAANPCCLPREAPLAGVK